MNNYTHKTPEAFEKEYILGPDGMFYTREVITTPIAHQKDIVMRCKSKPELHLNNALNLFDLVDKDPDSVIKQRFATGYYEGFYDNETRIKHIFVPVSKFPFPKANLFIRQFTDNEHNRQDYYCLYPTRVNNDDARFKKYTNTLSFTSRHHQLYIYFSLTQGYQTSSLNNFIAGHPYLFAIDNDTKEPSVMDLPNVYDTGRICTGDSYGNLSEIKSTYDAVIKILDELFSSPANADLFTAERHRHKFLNYKEDGSHDPTTDVAAYDTKEQGFFTPITKSQIIDFCEKGISWKI
jgi:hypothetical protein